MNTELLVVLTLGIIVIKAIWIHTEINFSKARINFDMIKTNAVEASILIMTILAAIYTPFPQGPLSWLITLSGVLLYVGGFVLAIWGRRTMNDSWGIPGVRDTKKQKHLVTTGPFSFSRNPIYVAFLMLYLGFAIAIQSWLIILRIPLAIYFYKAAKEEEENLQNIFGEEYKAYKNRVPRFL